MKTRAVPAFSSALGLLISLLLSNCSLPPRNGFKSATLDHAFVTYWPPGKDDKRLRVAVKDLIDMKGYVTTAGSEFLEKNAKPATKDAACLAIARKRGVDFVGKTNLTELAVSVSGINTYFGTPHNPLNHRRRLIPGGSSSGSAVAVADDEADVAFGTDTAGSIRVPAACCGVYGLKTTFGLVSLDGVYPIAPTTLDTVGPMAKDLPRLVIGMDLLHEGFAEQYRRVVADHPTAKALRVGRLYLHGTDPKVDAAIDSALQKAGFEIVPVPDAFRDAWVQAQRDALTVATSSAWVHDQSFAGQPGVRPRADATVFLGLLNFRFGADKDALHREHAWKTVLNGVLKRVDFIALPTVQSLPYHIPLFGGTIAFEARVMGWQNTEAVNYAGNPAIAVPVPIQSKLVPLTSLQLIGRPLGEADLCNAARLVDSAVRPDIRPSGQERNQ